MAREHLCSFNHPCMTGDDTWRDIAPEHRKLQSCKGLPDIKPLATNGILVYGLTLSGADTIYHLDNILFEKPEQVIKPKKPKPVSNKPKRLTKLQKAEAELARLQELAASFL